MGRGRDSRSRSRSRRGGGRNRSDSRGRGRRNNGRHTGTVVAWHDEKGFGFIKPDEGGEDVFAHATGLRDGEALREGDVVKYEVNWDSARRKYRAEEVTGCVMGRGGDRGRHRSRGRSVSRGRRGGGGRGDDEVCRQYQRRGDCDYGSNCRFAH